VADFVSPKKVSDIWIERVFQVECADHGVIDQCRKHGDAVAARREHWFSTHNAGREENRG